MGAYSVTSRYHSTLWVDTQCRLHHFLVLHSMSLPIKVFSIIVRNGIKFIFNRSLMACWYLHSGFAELMYSLPFGVPMGNLHID